MANKRKDDPVQKQHQQGAPQNTRDMPSSGNSPNATGATTGSDEGINAGSDVERPGYGTARQRAPQQGDTTGGPGESPGRSMEIELEPTKEIGRRVRELTV